MKLAWVLTRTIRTAGLRKNGGSNGFFFRKMSFSESHSAPFGNLAGDSLDHASADVKFVDVTNTTGINDHGRTTWADYMDYLLGIVFIAAGTYGLLRGFRVLKAKFCA
jgi:hypothetical protein